MTLRIVRAKLDDAALVRRIMQEAFAEYLDVLRPPSGAHRETVADVRRALAEGGGALAWDGSTAAGSARYRLEPDHVYVGRVAVLPAYRRLGIASALMSWMEERAREASRPRIQVGVRMSLPSNLALYRRLGYELVEVAPHPKGPDMVGTLIKHLRA